MITNTSNKEEHKCPCKEFKMEWTMKDERAFQLGEKSGKKEGIKQGYTKALDDKGLVKLADVEKIIDKTSLESFSDILHKEDIELILEEIDRFKEELKQSLAKLKEKKA